MRVGYCAPRWALGLTLAATLPVLQGCTPGYWNNRAADANDIADVGLTYTTQLNFSLYVCLLGFATLGGGYVDGYYVGAGGGQVGVVRHYQQSVGLGLWSYEEFGWGDPTGQTTGWATVDRRYVGVLGWIFGPNKKFAPA